MRRIPNAAWAALLVGAVVLMTGCGSGGDDRPSPPASEAGSTPGQLGAAHILIMHKESDRVPPDVTRTREEALTLVQEIAAELKEEGADFATLAMEHSDCPSASRGGDLGTFAPKQMVAAFSEATMNLEVGQVSDPVETQFGFHIIRRTQ